MKSPESLDPGLRDHRGEVPAGGGADNVMIAALSLAKQGFSVFPCKLDKAPLVPKGFHAATTDEERIRLWWQRWPEALIGVATGAVSGIVAVDIDDMNAEMPGDLPPTRVHHTRSGGRHYIYAYVDGARCTQGLVPGVDVRGDGGYVIWWPAHGLEVERANIKRPALPSWAYVNGAKAPEAKGTAAAVSGVRFDWDVTRAIIGRELETMDPDCGYEEWYRIGMAIHHESGGVEDGLRLWESWSSKGAKYKANECGYKWSSFKTDRDAQLSWNSVKKPRAKPVEEEVNGFDGLDLMSDLLDQEFPPTPLILDGAIRLTPGAWILAGRPKDGKTWLAMNLACAVAGGVEYVGSKPPRAGLVVYAALDDGSKPRFTQRFTAMEGTREIANALLVMTKVPDSFESPLLYVTHLLEQHPGVKLIVIDTLSSFRNPKRADQVYQQEYGEIKQLNDLGQLHGCCILIVHHFRKGQLDPTFPFESISGTLGLQGGCNGMIVLHRKDYTNPLNPDQDERLGAIWARGRDIDDCDVGARLRDGKWSVIGGTQDVLQGELLREVMRVLRSDMSRSWTSKEVAGELEGYKLDNVRKALQRAVRSRLATSTQGINGGYRASVQ